MRRRTQAVGLIQDVVTGGAGLFRKCIKRHRIHASCTHTFTHTHIELVALHEVGLASRSAFKGRCCGPRRLGVTIALQH